MLFNNRFDFDITILCWKASEKSIALARVGHYINLAQHRSIMNACIYLFAVWILSAGMDVS